MHTLNKIQGPAATQRSWWSLDLEEKQTSRAMEAEGRMWHESACPVSGENWCQKHALGPAMFRLSIGRAYISWPFMYKELPTDVIYKLNTLGLFFFFFFSEVVCKCLRKTNLKKKMV